MTVRMPIVRISANRSAHAGLDHVGQLDDAEHPRAFRSPPLGDDQRRPALRGDRVDGAAVTSAGTSRLPDHAAIAEPAPLRTARPSTVSPDIRVCAVNGTNSAVASSGSPLAAGRARFAQSSTMLRPSGVSSARLDSRAAAASSASCTPGAGISAVAGGCRR